MEREQMIGKQSILFHNAVHILSGASMVGKKEGDGPLGKYFDKIGEEDGLFGCQSWEEAESILQKEAVSMAIKKVGLSKEEIRMIYAETCWHRRLPLPLGLLDLKFRFMDCMELVRQWEKHCRLLLWRWREDMEIMLWQ